MKKIILFLSILLTVGLTSCADEKIIDGVKYEPYGLANEDVRKNDSIQYEMSPGSVICGILFCETIVVPVYVVGWNLYEPIKKK